MNNRGMVFLLLGIVLAAMVLITVNRPGVVTPDAPAVPAVASVASGPSGTDDVPASVPAVVPAGVTENTERDTPAVATPAPPAAPAMPSVPETPPAPPAVANAPAVNDTPTAPSNTASPATAPSNPTPSAPDGALVLRVPSGVAETPPAPARPAPVGGGNLDMVTQPRTGVPSTPAAPTTPTGGTSETGGGQIQVDPNAEHTLSIIALRFAGQGMILKIQAQEPFTCKRFVLPNPERLVVDLEGTWTNMRAPMVPDNALITGVRTGRQEKAARLVLDLTRPLTKYDAVRISPTEVEIHME